MFLDEFSTFNIAYLLMFSINIYSFIHLILQKFKNKDWNVYFKPQEQENRNPGTQNH